MASSAASRLAATRLERAQQRAATHASSDDLRRQRALQAREQEREREAEKEVRELEAECNRALDAVKYDARSLVMGYANLLRSDRSFILAACKLNGDALKFAPVQFNDDFEIVLAAVKRKGSVLEHVLGYCSSAIRRDRRIMLAAAAHHGVLPIIPDEFKADKEIVWEAVSRHGGTSIRHAAPSLRADRDFMFKVVTQGGGDPLRYASAELQADREFVLHCVRFNPSNVQHASAELRDDFDVMMASLQVADGERTNFGTFKERANGGTFEFASAALRSNPAFVIAALRLAKVPASTFEGTDDAQEAEHHRLMHIVNGRLDSMFKGELECEVWLTREVTLVGIDVTFWGTWRLLLPPEEDFGVWHETGIFPFHEREYFEEHEAALLALRADTDVMLAAVRHDGAALRCASEALRGERDIVMAAVANNGSALEYASATLRDDEEVVRTALDAPVGRLKGAFRQPFQFASERVRALKDIALIAMQRDGMMLHYASRELQGDREVVLAAVSQAGDALSFASDTLCGDRDVVLSAVRTAGDVLQFASDELKADAEVVRTAVSQNGVALEDASDELAG